MNKMAEVSARLNILKNYYKVDDSVSEAFRYGDVWKSENGILWELSPKERETVLRFEKEYDSVVYHVVLNHTDFGDLYSLLYVSNYPEEWDDDRLILKAGTPCVYVANATFAECSEFHSVTSFFLRSILLS